ncbi:hypothetical protein FA15DRAFT_667162 [Coprinopsis marcescibilis]|uniref:DUF4246 domain-containing protein n=1 Tax=Coprinopsis marcescibilis TaxID=230819 RepID=A0A5C3L3E9_COPMA|nr:hypothetical protein FA15DRAFT_667162 [Coprinopsis marcescibilis]
MSEEPLRLEKWSKGYRHPFIVGSVFSGGVGDNPRTLVDLAMSQLSAQLRRKPEWWMWYSDEKERSLWAIEVSKLPLDVEIPAGINQVSLSSKQIHYVLDELDGYAKLRDQNNQCQVSCFERIWESDSLIDWEILPTLRQDLSKLSKHRPHPLVTQQLNVSTLINPLLYCLVYGRTLVSVSRGNPPRPVLAPALTDIYSVCSQFAVLPSDVSISEDGTASFLSYINDLDPDEHRDLYISLGTLLSKSIPLFEHVLTDLHRNNPLPQRIPGAAHYTVWDEPDPPEHSDDEEGWIKYEINMRNWVLERPIQLPDVPDSGYSKDLERRRHVVSLKGKRLQVITRLSHLRIKSGQPEIQPAWGVEGMRNERVVACALHILTCDNIKGSLEFRMAVAYPRGFLPGDEGATFRTWGLRDGDPCHQYVGSVHLREKLSIAFPNIYQHCLASLDLENPQRDGHLITLKFLLVDPEIHPILSTNNVAPQQQLWIKKALYQALLPRLPAELIESIYVLCEGLMSSEEAKEYQTQYEDILTNFNQDSNENYFCVPFDLWIGET